jgi:hypothetical protein
MPWHQSKSDPRKVYDSGHNVVCVCMHGDQAALIVKAVNSLPGAESTFVKLREPAAIPDATGQAEPLDTFEQDNCCGTHLAKAGRSGVLASLTSWECPRCGTEWVAKISGPIRHWCPTAAIAIFK